MHFLSMKIIRLALATIFSTAFPMYAQNSDAKTAYLSTYISDEQSQENNICFALSNDGIHFTPLNGGLPIIANDTIAITGSMRPPHIQRSQDGKTFLQVATFMQSSTGNDRNDALVFMKSTDLIHWTHSIIHFSTSYPKQFAEVKHVGAPHIIYDQEMGKYLVYFAFGKNDASPNCIYYSYANASFTALETRPALFYESSNSKSIIDANIVYSPSDKLYHLFMETEGDSGLSIAHATSRTLMPAQDQRAGDQWVLLPYKIEQSNPQIDGFCITPTLDGKGWILIQNCLKDGYNKICFSADLKSFTPMANVDTKDAFIPRQGSILPITENERKQLLSEWGNHGNPILPNFHADPEILYSHKTKHYYIYSTTDGIPNWGGWTFSVFSSDNLKNWKNEGIVLNAKSEQVKWANGSLWAPAAIEVKQRDGTYKYYLYFSADAGMRKEIGVAVSDSPLGPFIDSGCPIVSESPTGYGQQIDVDVFFDPKSKKYYLYWGNGYMAGAELNADLLSIKKETIKVMTPQGGTLQTYAYREAPYVFYRKGLYYFLWSVDDTGSPNYHVCYGTSTQPLGNIKVADAPIILNQCPQKQIYGTAHNSVLQIPSKDEWYIVYHRINRHFVNPSQSPGTHREVCIDRMTFDKKGHIVPITPTIDGPAPINKPKSKRH